MPAPYSSELRSRVVAAYVVGDETYQSVAETFRVGIATVNRWLRLRREAGNASPRPHGGGNPRRLDENGDALLVALVRAQPDATLVELAERIEAQSGRRITKSSIARALARLGITRKKRLSSQRNERAIPPDCCDGTSRASAFASRPKSSFSSMKVG